MLQDLVLQPQLPQLRRILPVHTPAPVLHSSQVEGRLLQGLLRPCHILFLESVPPVSQLGTQQALKAQCQPRPAAHGPLPFAVFARCQRRDCRHTITFTLTTHPMIAVFAAGVQSGKVDALLSTCIPCPPRPATHRAKMLRGRCILALRIRSPFNRAALAKVLRHDVLKLCWCPNIIPSLGLRIDGITQLLDPLWHLQMVREVVRRTHEPQHGAVVEPSLPEQGLCVRCVSRVETDPRFVDCLLHFALLRPNKLAPITRHACGTLIPPNHLLTHSLWSPHATAVAAISAIIVPFHAAGAVQPCPERVQAAVPTPAVTRRGSCRGGPKSWCCPRPIPRRGRIPMSPGLVNPTQQGLARFCTVTLPALFTLCPIDDDPRVLTGLRSIHKSSELVLVGGTEPVLPIPGLVGAVTCSPLCQAVRLLCQA
mmetsp:Transcript_22753/g.52852  ORF Transcript_22753/g.52852 Transcript_22753/m.52852 type:complete len:425 (+) Transcript_22753:1630-2904(+)